MVKMMLDGFGGDQRKNPDRRNSTLPIQCYHVDARFATDLKDIGSFRPGKGFRLLRYIAEAIWCRFRYGADVLYYVPAMPLKATILRDIAILSIIRPFFRKTIFFWHAAGLGAWLESPAASAPLRFFTRKVLRGADLSLSPAPANVADLQKFAPKRSGAVPYGIPDPCPDFETTLLPVRRERMEARERSIATGNPTHVSIAYMALCFEEKGLLDAVEALRLLQEKRPPLESPFTFSLTVAGKFLNAEEESKFWTKVKQHSLENEVKYIGFVSGDGKNALLASSDVFCFPTYFSGESAPVVLTEAFAFGLPTVTTNWRNIPDFFPAGYAGIVEIKRPDLVAAAILKVLAVDPVVRLRETFLARYTIQQHLRGLSEAFLAVNR